MNMNQMRQQRCPCKFRCASRIELTDGCVSVAAAAREEGVTSTITNTANSKRRRERSHSVS